MAGTLLTALFEARTHAERAARRLRELGLAAGEVRIVAQPGASPAAAAGLHAHETWLLNAELSAADLERAATVLREAHATHVERRESQDWPAQPWMGLHDGRQTQAGVPPGLGDAETGTSAASGARTGQPGADVPDSGSRA